MAQQSRNVRGYTVLYEENAIKGVDHLHYVLDFQEADDLFKRARNYGKAIFEDRAGRNFILTHNPDGTYTLKVRGSSWW